MNKHILPEFGDWPDDFIDKPVEFFDHKNGYFRIEEITRKYSYELLISRPESWEIFSDKSSSKEDQRNQCKLFSGSCVLKIISK